MEDIIAKNLLCERTCFKCDHFIATRSGDPNIFTPHCHRKDVHPDEDTCEQWKKKQNYRREDDEFVTMRTLLKKYKEESHETI